MLAFILIFWGLCTGSFLLISIGMIVWLFDIA